MASSKAQPPLSSSPSPGKSNSSSGGAVRSLMLKALCLLGGALLLRRLTRNTTRWDHARNVAQALSGEKFSTEQAISDPLSYFNIRLLTCPATILADGSRVLYFEQVIFSTPHPVTEPSILGQVAFWRTPERPYRQRFLKVKPCPKELKCDVEVAYYAIRDTEEYRNYCDRPESQRPQPEEVVGDVAEHLNSIYLSRCENGKRCLYEGATPPEGFPNFWNGASHCTSELTIHKNGEVHSWDRGYDDEGNQGWFSEVSSVKMKVPMVLASGSHVGTGKFVTLMISSATLWSEALVWGVSKGPYEFKPVTATSSSLLGYDEFLLSDKQPDKNTMPLGS